MVNISLIVLNCDREKYIKDCLMSCFNQDSKYSFEIILVDDGSKDHSLEIAKSLKKKNYFIYPKENSGIEKSSNLGFSVANGEYVARIDSDDLLNRDYLKNIMYPFKKNISFVYSDYAVIDNLGKKIGKMNLPKFSPNEIYKRGDFLATGTMYRKSEIKKFQYYNTKVKNCGLENYELIIKLLLAKRQGFRVKKKLFCLRKHKTNLSTLKRKKILDYGIKMFKRYQLNEWEPRIQAYGSNKFNPIFQ